ncbi:MAG TPA: N-acetylmuramoyl-L-alanine amidase, partial [Candidatus Eremiobacteraceae bacterium]|nr:N-acetylmuramoyl-L-alanine amidase [Candidatus Eremiobacteraceae bacterium]
IDARPYGIVESDPYGGWLFFPPPGTPFAITGSAGDYYRVALGSAEHAWVEKQSLQLLQPGTPAPQAQVQDVVIADGLRASTVNIHLTGRVPFRIDESVDGPTLRVRIYGATAATDFIRYGDDRSNIRAVRWDQLSGGIATLEIALRQRTLWGYHAVWNGNDISLAIKRAPAFRRAPAPALQGLLVVIDPGHSPDTGAIGPLGTQERDVNLAIAKRLAAHVESLGARAVLTRYANVPVGLYDRTLLAARLNADILISVHNNALPDGANPFTHHGYSVYYYQPQSLELARAIHASYARHTSLADYGLYFDNLALARPTDEPAVLTESAFIMWPAEEMLLRSPTFQNTLGATLADGMERWAEAMRTRELAR